MSVDMGWLFSFKSCVETTAVEDSYGFPAVAIRVFHSVSWHAITIVLIGKVQIPCQVQKPVQVEEQHPVLFAGA